jgi:hypothetical protein
MSTWSIYYDESEVKSSVRLYGSLAVNFKVFALLKKHLLNKGINLDELGTVHFVELSRGRQLYIAKIYLDFFSKLDPNLYFFNFALIDTNKLEIAKRKKEKEKYIEKIFSRICVTGCTVRISKKGINQKVEHIFFEQGNLETDISWRTECISRISRRVKIHIPSEIEFVAKDPKIQTGDNKFNSILVNVIDIYLGSLRRLLLIKSKRNSNKSQKEFANMLYPFLLKCERSYFKNGRFIRYPWTKIKYNESQSRFKGKARTVRPKYRLNEKLKSSYPITPDITL